ncbi:response regulator transcription factor [Harryflintia acetispora]|uniref:response regulator transcription factor n=1 Tax=Harryflintia acetispora TaxID=1849041 RepID=UPI001898583B|nr:response regulator transcription factor [Harryflintia acetispora]
MPKLMIADDDLHLRKLVRTYAELEGYQCEEAENGFEALEKLRDGSYDLMILDIMMPGMDGFETLADFRNWSQAPVILLTARDEEYDKLFGFNLGADDYLSKPFSPKELMARVKAVLKRAGTPKDEPLQFGGLRIVPNARAAQIEGTPLNLPPKEFDLLLTLAQNEHAALSRKLLLQRVWGYDYVGDARTVDTHVGSLRDHLGDYRKLIQTVWGVGYKFEYKKGDEPSGPAR